MAVQQRSTTWRLPMISLVRERVVPVPEPDRFCAHIAFSLKTRAIWADLSQGVLYCNLATRSCSPVPFTFLNFPSLCCIDITSDPEMPPLHMFRTMGPVGDSIIRFVSIDYTGDIGDRMVRVWTLPPLLDDGREELCDKWSQDQVFRVTSIWEQEGFKKAGLPEMVPKCPVLLPNGDLCLLLPNKRLKLEDSADDFVCVLDLLSKKIKWSARLHGFHTRQPTILPPEFFKGMDPLCPHKFMVSLCESKLSSFSISMQG
ncbi:hypothetical protein QOZ80_3AG0210810 [Eleusine coracana subsp. coracana]|nr:hypothetical protein QOZ80_3AG0210810 [Eleusine coracana subsp. coracana]